jgi:hypothetical protein
MKERPILFSAPMVRAILDGNKTQTRRIAKTVTSLPEGQGFTCLRKPKTNICLPLVDGQWQWQPAAGDSWRPYPKIAEYCPYGQPGDRLWVRETWAPHADIPRGTIYRADPGGDYQDNSDGFKWHPSIHMHRWRSRITLEIESIRVERLNAISESDAMDEGAGLLIPEHEYLDGNPDQYRRCFQMLWESINGPGSWDANPWVWVLSFNRLPQP